jgi:hypothetical protein
MGISYLLVETKREGTEEIYVCKKKKTFYSCLVECSSVVKLTPENI